MFYPRKWGCLLERFQADHYIGLHVRGGVHCCIRCAVEAVWLRSSLLSSELHPPRMVRSFSLWDWSHCSGKEQRAHQYTKHILRLSPGSWVYPNKVTLILRRSTVRTTWPTHLRNLSPSRSSFLWRWVWDTFVIGFSSSGSCWDLCPKPNHMMIVIVNESI